MVEPPGATVGREDRMGMAASGRCMEPLRRRKDGGWDERGRAADGGCERKRIEHAACALRDTFDADGRGLLPGRWTTERVRG
eukprot:CAMPEP_0113932094 /NCGR_PEP_ID=MMETSP1159-20121227/6916_1 /TAXON_ID=88271 /ORGANISM="Picocystis salinarum" /LENGTH=81 /DNA_ID=CAMNT_0000933153 /DNA_START=11 /DNA_END=253 /DNA_ORIENTATION=- /assembly_acc=CAM_ASM_000767